MRDISSLRRTLKPGLRAPAGALARYRQPLGMLLITAILAACFTSIKAGLDFSPPLLFGSLRALTGGAALLGLLILARRPSVPPRWTWPGMFGLAALATTRTYAAMFLSPGRTEAGIASAVGNLQPFLTLLLAAAFLGEALSRGKVLVVLLGLMGVSLISYPAVAGPGALGISGVMLAFTVSAAASTANIVVKRLRLGDQLLAVTAWQFLIGGAILFLLSISVEDTARLEVNLEFAGILLFLGLLGTAFTTALWFSFVQEGDVGRLATFFYLVPVIGLGIATIALGEPLSMLALAGALTILVAVGVMAFQRPAPTG